MQSSNLVENEIRSVLGTKNAMTFDQLQKAFAELTFDQLPIGYRSIQQIQSKMPDKVKIIRYEFLFENKTIFINFI